MLFCCSDKSRRDAQEDEIKKAIGKTRFNRQEVTELRSRFYRMSKNTGRLRKEQFREHMGVLGLDTVFILSDRIFTMLDTDGDGQINFQDFINYFDIITYGTQEQKAQMAFNYIDTKNQGSFELQDLKTMIGGIINSYCAVTGAHLNEEMQRRFDVFICHIFDQMNIQKTGKVTFVDYSEAIRINPNILEIFEFLNKGIQETIKDDTESRNKDIQISKMLQQVENQLDQVIGILSGEKEDSTPPSSFQHQQKSISFKRGSIRNINKTPSENDIETNKFFPLLTVPNIVTEEYSQPKDKSQTQVIQEDIINEDNQSKGKSKMSEDIKFIRNSNRTLTCPMPGSKNFLKMLEYSDTNSKSSPEKIDSQTTNKKKLLSQEMLNSESDLKRMEEIQVEKQANIYFSSVSPSVKSNQKQQKGMQGSVSFQQNIFQADPTNVSIEKRNNMLQEFNSTIKNYQNSDRQIPNNKDNNSSEYKQNGNYLSGEEQSQSIVKKKQLSMDRGYRHDDENYLSQLDQYSDRKLSSFRNKLPDPESASIQQDIQQLYTKDTGSRVMNEGDSKDYLVLNNTNSTHRLKSKQDLHKITVDEEEERHDMSTLNEDKLSKKPSSHRYGAECLKVSFVKLQSKYQNEQTDPQYNSDFSDFTDEEVNGEDYDGINERNALMDNNEYINQNRNYLQPNYTSRFMTRDQQTQRSTPVLTPPTIVNHNGIAKTVSNKDLLSANKIFNGQVLQDNNKYTQPRINNNCNNNNNGNGKISASAEIPGNNGNNNIMNNNLNINSNNRKQQGSQKNILLVGGMYPLTISMPQGTNGIIQQVVNSKGQIIDPNQQYIEGTIQNIQNNDQVPIISFQSGTQGQSSDRSNHSSSSQRNTNNNNNSNNTSNNNQKQYSNANFYNIQNSKILANNDFILASNEQNLLKEVHNSKVNISISNNFFLHHPPQIQSPPNHHTPSTATTTPTNTNNNIPTNPTTNNSSTISNKPITVKRKTSNQNESQQYKKDPSPPPLPPQANNPQEQIYGMQQLQISLTKDLSSGGSNSITNTNNNIQNNIAAAPQNNQNFMNNSNNLSISNSQISQGSNINHLNKSGFFKEHQKTSIYPSSLTPSILSDPKHKQFIKSVTDMSNEQLKERVLGLYQKLFEMKEVIKVIRKDLDDNSNPNNNPAISNNAVPANSNLGDDNKDVSILNDKNNHSFAVGRPQRFSSNKNHSPRNVQSQQVNNIFLRENSANNNPVNPPINIANQDDQFRTMRISTAINVPNKNAQRNQSMRNRTMVFFGHQNWNLVLNMMMGVQMAVKSVSSFGEIVSKLEPQDYKLKYYFELLPRRRVGEQSTFKICKFSDYAPQVFRMIRNKYNISSESYLKSIGPEALFGSLMRGDLTTLSELTSTGKSGSFFYYTVDSRFTLKTIHKSEFSFLKKILPYYHQHLEDNPNTLIIRVYGLHKIKYRMRNSIRYRYIYFIIMSNVFHTRKEIHERFDLKGSLYKRFSDNPDPSVAKKDLNFLNQKIKIQVKPDQYYTYMDVVRKDCFFFESNQIIDYSMLLGLHYSRRDKRNTDTDILLNFQQETLHESEEESVCLMKSRSNEITYHFGIIDILTCFNTKKKVEFLAKRIALGPDISTIPPQQYAARFIQFIENMFDESSKNFSAYNASNASHNNLPNLNSNVNNANSTVFQPHLRNLSSIKNHSNQ